MKYLPIFFLTLSLFIGCSSVDVVKDKFDNSISIKLEEHEKELFRLDGRLRIDKVIFSKEYQDEKFSDSKIFFKFVGFHGEVLEGNTIELNVGGTIFKIPLLESRMDDLTQERGTYTRIGNYTYSNSTNSQNIIVMEAVLPKNVQDDILKSKSLMMRLYTKNIDGIAKNIFEYTSSTVSEIKEFINYIPEK